MSSNLEALDFTSTDPTISPPMDEFEDLIDYKDALTFDDDPIFDDSWKLSTTPPYDDELYSLPPSWSTPDTRFSVLSNNLQLPSVATTNILTAAQQEHLRNIAMPPDLPLQNPSPQSMTHSSYKSGSVSSPEQQHNSRKRKNSEDEVEEEEADNGEHPPVKKTAHNMIEKRYRNNLNDKIAALRDSVPSLRVMSKAARGEEGEKEDLQGLTPAHKLNKATVLAKATEYIRHLEKRNKHLLDESAAMKARIAAFEKLFLSGALGVNPQPQASAGALLPDQIRTPHAQVSTTLTPDISPSGMIEVPEDFRRLHAATQLSQQTYQVPEDTYQPVYRQQSSGWQNPGGVFGKMMVGSLAGLMILEGISEAGQPGEDSGDRGLFALPVGLIRGVARQFFSSGDISILGYHSSMSQTLSLIKVLLVFGALIHVFLPSFSTQNPKQDSKVRETPKVQLLTAAPSLASSIQVRRQAWLTAVQNFWTPEQNFFLEAAKLSFHMLLISIKNAVGWYGYSANRSVTEQQEAERIRTWEIALDAQLAGGDVEVSKRRLILTLMASGTLPDTPVRLMLKSIHVRVLLWEFGNSGFNGIYMFKEFTAKLARWKWNEAQKLHKLLVARADLRPPNYEPLPEHLAILLERPCDDVLVDSIGQRAYNLCWNLPTTHNLIGPSDGMDNVVDDFAIRSPLDAVAAWWSSLVLQRAFADSLQSKDKAVVREDVALAIKTAPTGSGVQLRALVARAVLVEERRGASIATALQILAPPSPRFGTPSTTDASSNDVLLTPTSTQDASVQAAPSSILMDSTAFSASLPDLHTALSCAMAIAHLKRSPTSPAALSIINETKLTQLSLLGFTAAYKLMEAILESPHATSVCSRKIEHLAGSLRIWIGTPAGLQSGLSKEVEELVVTRCIGVTKKLIGIEKDLGYESMSETEVV